MARKSSKKLDSLAEKLQSKGTPVLETGHEVWLAGLGALSVARKKGEKVAGKGSKMFDRLVAEGQKLEKKVGKTVRSEAHEVAERISGAAEKAKDQAKKTVEKAKSQVKKSVDNARAQTKKTADQAKKAVAKSKDEAKKSTDKAKDQAKKTADKAKQQTKKTVGNAKAQIKKTAVKVRGQVKKAATKKAATRVMPKQTGPVTLHLVPKADEWAVRLEGSEEDLSLHPTKYVAVKAARGIARARAPSHLIVHRSDGTVQESFSYD